MGGAAIHDDVTTGGTSCRHNYVHVNVIVNAFYSLVPRPCSPKLKR